MRPLRAAFVLLATASAALVGCGEEARLVVELVPNPEVNTRDQVRSVVNGLEVVLDVEGGFAALEATEGETVGAFIASDLDADGVLELVLRRPGGEVALEPFGLAPGSQGDRVITVTARGLELDRRLAALGSARGQLLAAGSSRLEVPFNLLPAYRPLRVVSISPPDGAVDLEAPVAAFSLDLAGDLAEDAVAGRVRLRLESFGGEMEPAFSVSYVETGLGRVTTLRALDCPLTPGNYAVVVDTTLCTRTGRCLDQDLGLDGAQPFVGRFSVRGVPRPPVCVVVETGGLPCPQEPCPDGYRCVEEACVYDGGTRGGLGDCDPSLCGPPAFVCDGASGACLPDCRLYGACPEPTERCDELTGLCARG